MSSGFDSFGFGQLSVADRLRLIGEIWDSIPDDEAAQAVGLPDWHKEILDARLDAIEATPGVGATWDEVKARLWKTS